MALLTINSKTFDNWNFDETSPKLRATPSREFLAVDNSGNEVLVGGNEYYLEWPITLGTRVDGTGKVITTFTIPDVEIYSTTDAIGFTGAYYRFTLHDSFGNLLAIWDGFERVALPAFSGNDAEWDDVYVFNHPQAPILIDRETLTRDQIVSLIGDGGGAVDSVFGRAGVVVAQSGDYIWAQINKTVSDIADITNRAHSSLTGIGTNTHAQIDSHIASISNPHAVTKAQVGLSNVDNTSDANKPISTATQAALDLKQALDSDLTAIAGLTPVNDDIIQRKAGAWVNRTPAQLKTDLVLTKGDVGLGNVDNTSDANKPISTATQSALDGKAALSHTHNASDINAGTLADGRLSSNVPLKNASNTFTNDNTFVAPNTTTTAMQVNSAAGAVGARVDTFKVVVDGSTALSVGYGNTSGSYNNRFVQTVMPFYVGNDNDPLLDYAGNYFHAIRARTKVSGNPNDFDKWEGITSWMNLDGLTAPTSGTQDFFAYNGEAGVSDVANTHNVWTVYAAHMTAFHKGAGNINDGLIGVMGKSFPFGSGTVTKQRGVQGWAASQTGATGTSTLAQGVYGIVSNVSGYTMTTAVAVDALLDSNAGTMGTAYVIRARAETTGAGTVTGNRYGLHIANQTGVGTVSGTAYNLYSAGSNSKNLFEGIVILTQLNDSNSNELLKFTGVGSAINELTVTNAATGNSPSITSTGGDTDIGIGVQTKGTGAIRLGTASDATSFIEVSQFGILTMFTSGTQKAVMNGAGGGNSAFYRVSSDGQFGFTDALNVNTSTPDTGLARQSAGIVRITNASTGTGDILAGKFLFSTGITPLGIFFGSGSPEGVLTAAIGSIYLRTNGGAGTSHYVKESGSGNTGWVAK